MDGRRCSCLAPGFECERCRSKRKKAALCGCGLLENVADLVIQRCRRTRRDPSSSNERRRKMARSWVRWNFMRPHTTEQRAVSSLSEPGDAAVQVILVRALDFGGDDFANAQRASA